MRTKVPEWQKISIVCSMSEVSIAITNDDDFKSWVLGLRTLMASDLAHDSLEHGRFLWMR